MNWQEIWTQFATRTDDAMEQVGRTVNFVPMSEVLVAEIVGDIVEKTNMQMGDNVLDICCGNGILTQKIAHYCTKIIGIDREKLLIERAERDFGGENISYWVGDALDVEKFVNQQFEVIILYFSFQYFDTIEKGEKMIAAMLSLLKPNGCILIGDVPNRDKISVLYPKRLHRFRYWISCYTGKNAMGKFWKYEEITTICKKHHAKVQICPQKASLPYSHYRTDFLIRKE
jgi:ubiquinone/menaquinone biosynthesis C-methylase UbiE